MPLTQQDLEEFKAIYRQEFDTELSDAEALEVAQAALTLVETLCDILPQDGYCISPPGTVA